MAESSDKKKLPHPQDDDTQREKQSSHRDQQNRSKKEGHPSQIGSGHDQQSARVGTHDPINRRISTRVVRRHQTRGGSR